MTQENATYNGWTNWDTWEAYNILTENETYYGLFLRFRCERDIIDFFEMVIGDMPLWEAIDLDEVNYEELLNAIDEE